MTYLILVVGLERCDVRSKSVLCAVPEAERGEGRVDGGRVTLVTP